MEKPNYWAVIPAHIRCAENLPANAKLLYAEISSLTNAAGYCFATNAYFENLYTLSERTIIRLLKALEKEGYIRIEDAEGGKAQRRIYAGINPLHSPPDKNVSTPLTKMSVPPDKNVTHNKKYNIKSNNPPIAPQIIASLDWEPQIFETFWKAYPAIDGKRPAKARALKAWNKLKPDSETISKMSDALQRDKKSEMWRKGVGIPYASTWLNQRRWEDEVVDATPEQEHQAEQRGGYEQW